MNPVPFVSINFAASFVEAAAVVEGAAGPEQEASLDGPAGDGDEGGRVGYVPKFSGHTV